MRLSTVVLGVPAVLVRTVPPGGIQPRRLVLHRQRPLIIAETRAYRPARNIFAGFRVWPKTLPDLISVRPVLWAFDEGRSAWPRMILFGQPRLRESQAGRQSQAGAQ